MKDDDFEYDIELYQAESLDVLNRVHKFMENLVLKRDFDADIVANAFTMCGIFLYDQIIDDDGEYDVMLEQNRVMGQKFRKKERM